VAFTRILCKSNSVCSCGKSNCGYISLVLVMSLFSVLQKERLPRKVSN
jgi:xanthine dehydrogenase iron-sulfur cluster and FAD-binding subunit A